MGRSVGADGESGPFSPEPHQRAEEMEEAPRVATLTLDREARILRREGIPGLHGGEPAVGADPPLHRCSRDETISLRPGGCLGIRDGTTRSLRRVDHADLVAVIAGGRSRSVRRSI